MKLPSSSDLAKLPDLFQVRYALYAATKVAHLTALPEAATCLKVVGDYLDGKATKEDCRVAATAAADAAYVAANAAYVAANAAANADAAAAYAADAANVAYVAANAAAYVAANAAAYAAAYVAATAADAAYYATHAATAAAYAAAAYSKKTKLGLVKDLRRYYEELLNFDAISESYLLGT